jgi:hypothetical protein
MNKYASEAVKLVDIPAESEEYRRVIYSLQLGLALPTADIEVKKCAAIPSSFLGFSKNETDSSIILDAWFDNSMQDTQNANTGLNQGSFNAVQ